MTPDEIHHVAQNKKFIKAESFGVHGMHNIESGTDALLLYFQGPYGTANGERTTVFLAMSDPGFDEFVEFVNSAQRTIKARRGLN